MALESATYTEDLVATNPDGASDPKSQGDDHIKLIKASIKATFPGLAGRFQRNVVKSGNYTAVLNDSSVFFRFSAAATLALTAAATLGNGWSCVVYANGGVVTVDPNGAETVNGGGSATIPIGKVGLLFCTGSDFYLFEVATLGGTVPSGTIMAYAGSSLPSGWYACYGQAVSRTSGNEGLFAAIGTTFGVGDGSTTFNLPDLRGRSIFGLDNMGGSDASRVTAAASGILGTTLGGVGGSQLLHAHTHTQQGTIATSSDGSHAHTVAGDNSGTGSADSFGHTVGNLTKGDSIDYNVPTSTTGAHTHNLTLSGETAAGGTGGSQNMPPAMMLYWIIRT